jgi:hypothetical protein
MSGMIGTSVVPAAASGVPPLLLLLLLPPLDELLLDELLLDELPPPVSAAGVPPSSPEDVEELLRHPCAGRPQRATPAADTTKRIIRLPMGSTLDRSLVAASLTHGRPRPSPTHSHQA